MCWKVMSLLILEGLGFILGYLFGFYGRKLNNKAHAERRKLHLLTATSFLIIALACGITTYAHFMKLKNQNILKDYVLGFVMFILPGMTIGTFVNWLVEKYSGAK